MNTYKTQYKGRTLEYLLFLSFDTICPNEPDERTRVIMSRAFANEFEKDHIEINGVDELKLVPMYTHDTEASPIIELSYKDDFGRKMLMTLNLANFDGKPILDFKNRILHINGVIKHYISNVLFDYAIPFRDIDRMEFRSKYGLNSKYLIETRQYKIEKNDMK